MVYRIFVEKKPAQANEARTLLGELQTLLGLSGITELRLFNRYDVEGVSCLLYTSSSWTTRTTQPRSTA